MSSRFTKEKGFNPNNEKDLVLYWKKGISVRRRRKGKKKKKGGAKVEE